MRTLLVIILLLSTSSLNAQTVICGRITDKTGHPLLGASAAIKGTIDGASSDTLGYFCFKTKSSGSQWLLSSHIGYQTWQMQTDLSGDSLTVNIVLQEMPTAIDDVVITAGSFEAGDKKRGVTLNAYDISTTPTALGSIYGALSTFPGTATIREDGRLFVRGGDAYEALTFIDGLRVKKPYTTNAPELPSQGRYSPMLFTGTTFSSGGYSAQYGQALSSALILQTTGLASEDQAGVGLLSMGLNGSETKTGNKASISVQGEYYNLALSNKINRQKVDWLKNPETYRATVVARRKIGKEGLLKFMAAFQHIQSSIVYPDFDHYAQPMDVEILNCNLFTNLSYNDSWGKGWTIKAGTAFSTDENRTQLGPNRLNENNNYLQAKAVVSKRCSPLLNLNFGAEASPNSFTQQYWAADTLASDCSFTDWGAATFAEAEAMLLNTFAVKAGLRGEHSSLLREFKVSPRLSLAWLLNSKSQVSLATGVFYQTPEDQLMRYTHNLKFEKAAHYIANYQTTIYSRILRIEAYYKKYSNLVCYDKDLFYDPASYSNSGNGYAKGIELFWRDPASIDNLDYWISYSLVDSKRIYRDYRAKVTPSFSPKHNLALVGKYYIAPLHTQASISGVAASGRPYNNPASARFMDGLTMPYFDCSITLNYLFGFMGKTSVVYFQLNNLFGRNNIYGYNYYKDMQGNYQRLPIEPSSTREVFVGLFLNL